MSSLIFDLTHTRVGTSAWRVIRRAAVDSVLGTAGGFLFGLVFGGFGMLFLASWKIIPTSGYFGLCGAAAGMLLGAFGALLDSDDDFEAAWTWRSAARAESLRVTPVLRPGDANRDEPQNRLAAFTNLDRRRAEISASRNPSRN
jgi:hypothetical protein